MNKTKREIDTLKQERKKAKTPHERDLIANKINQLRKRKGEKNEL